MILNVTVTHCVSIIFTQMTHPGFDVFPYPLYVLVFKEIILRNGGFNLIGY